MKNFLTPLIDVFSLIRAKLADLYPLVLLIIVTEEDLVFHRLQSGANLSQNDLIPLFLHIVKFLSELVRYLLHLSLYGLD